jgi:LacI family transcriptional regulator
MATIYEVAARAGVSPATVSRVMNGTKVSPELAELVRAAASELDFTPNRTARTLRRQNSEVIALIIPDIENPFFTALARGVEDRAQESGYSVVLCNTDEDTGKEARYIDIALSEHMAGVILAPASDHSDLSSLLARHRRQPRRRHPGDYGALRPGLRPRRVHHRTVGCRDGPAALRRLA